MTLQEFFTQHTPDGRRFAGWAAQCLAPGMEDEPAVVRGAEQQLTQKIRTMLTSEFGSSAPRVDVDFVFADPAEVPEDLFPQWPLPLGDGARVMVAVAHRPLRELRTEWEEV